LGEVRVASDCHDAECMVIEEPDTVINLYERKILQDNLMNDLAGIK